MCAGQRSLLLSRCSSRILRRSYSPSNLGFRISPPSFSHYSKSLNMAPTNTPSARPVVLCGPSGAGKSTLIKKLQDEFPGQYNFSVSREL